MKTYVMKLQATKEQIVALHTELQDSLKISLQKAINIGELLLAVKADLKHGEFTQWIENNLPFTDRTARNYMKLYLRREELKTETLSVMEAYKQLAPPGGKESLELKELENEHTQDNQELDEIGAIIEKLESYEHEYPSLTVSVNDPALVEKVQALLRIYERLDILFGRAEVRKIKSQRKIEMLLAG